MSGVSDVPEILLTLDSRAPNDHRHQGAVTAIVDESLVHISTHY